MNPTKLSITTEVSGTLLSQAGEEAIDAYVAQDMAKALSSKIAKKFPKGVIRVPVPAHLQHLPYDHILPKVRYQIDYRYQMDLYVLTEEEMEEFVEDIRKQTLMELAADRALYTLPEGRNMA